MKNKWKLIIIFFATFISLFFLSNVIKIPIYKSVQFSSIKFENTYKNIVVFNSLDIEKVDKLVLEQGGTKFIISKNQIIFKENGSAEIKNIDKKFNHNLETSAVAVLKSQWIMYYLINKTFSRK